MTKHIKVTAKSKTAPLKLKPLVSSILAWIHRPATLTLALGAMPVLAFAQMPTGGEVIAGSATIATPDAAHTVIQQGSDKAVINWQSFSIGKDGYVQFLQPGSSSVTLNRVVGVDPSAILGHLSANGQIFLVNSNGVFFGQSAVVDVGGIVATTLDINNEDFMRGDYRFARSTGSADRATVINEGSITAKNGGYVVLAGDYAANKGIVQAQLGTALLASGDALTLQTSGSGLVSYHVDKATVANLAGVENSGQILANGGRVIMTADVANDLASTVVNNSGLVQAQSVVEKDGAIYFEGQGGSVVNSGTLDASAQAGANAGRVDIRATGDITHESGSLINVSGAATGTSNAGSVHTWADGTNHYKKGASIVARGGAEGGDGGQVELSGNTVLNRSTVDLRAPKGKLGTLTLDPSAITIANGGGTNAAVGDESTIYEENLEDQLKVGNMVLAATGANASITLGDLADGVLDGTNAGSGGSLTLTASGSDAPAITFVNATNAIKVDGSLALAVDNGSGSNAIGSIAVGNLEAGSSIALKAGAVTAGNLTIAKTISTAADTSYNIDAHAYAGNLSVGDVKVDVSNDTAAGVSSSVALRAEGGSVNAGSLTSNATGLGYYNYNWSTAGNPATSYFGAQPWTLDSQADHAITSSLDIQATGNVTTDAIAVTATDTNTAFSENLGGYWETATDTQHNFWRPTAASANATINADGNVTLAGKTRVIADGYAMSNYSEVESWRTMVDNFNYTSANQTVHTDYGCIAMTDGACTGGYGYRNSYVYTDNQMKGSATGNYIWEFGDYTYNLPASSDGYPTRYQRTDFNTGTNATGMSYSGARGMSATLNVDAGGSVSMNGMEVRSSNHSATGNASYTDGNWGRQDTVSGLNGTASNFTSSSRETDYYDNFSTSYSAATSTATANITAGDNQSITLNGGSSYDVVGEDASGGSSGLAGASLNITAGVAGGAAGNGLISIGSGINVTGGKSGDVNLTISNLDGVVDTRGVPAVVTNGYSGGDSRAVISSGTGNVLMDSLVVNAGRSAYLTVNAPGNVMLDSLAATGGNSASINVNTAGYLTIANASTATVTGASGVGAAIIDLNGANGVSVGDLIASSTHMVNLRTNYDIYGSDQAIDGGTASVLVQSGGDVVLNGDVEANGYKTATITATAGADGTLTTTAGKSVSATTSGQTFTADSQHTIDLPTYSATTTFTAGGGLILGSSVGATVTNGNGAALVGLTTTGGSGASISQGDGSLIKASGSTGTVNVNAGSVSPTLSTAATLDMLGQIAAQGSSGMGVVTVNAASGTVSGLGASSAGNAASVTVNALDSAGVLLLGGSGAITANSNSSTGALLAVNAAGSLDTSAATIAVTNNSSGNGAGARANLIAANGYNKVGSMSVNGFNTAVLNATATGDATAAGTASASTTAASGHAEANLASTAAGVGIAEGGSLAATASGNLGAADVNLTGVTGATLDGNASATAASGTASLAITTTGGTDASIVQGANSVLSASGATSLVAINAGNVSPNAGNAAGFALNGDVQARSLGGGAAVAINGKSGSVHDFSVEGGVATADITAVDGALDLTGTGTVSGDTVATLNASSTGDLSTRDQIGASLTNPSGTAQVNLTSSSGALLVDESSHVVASSVLGKAEVNLTAATGMTLNGDLAAQSASNNATVDLVTTGGATAAIVQGANSTILADGNHAALTINAGNATPNASNAAAVTLAGNLQARGNAGTADVIVRAASGNVHDFSAASSNGGATVDIASLASNAALALNGAGSVTANLDSGTGALLKVTAAGSLNTSAANLTASNLNNGASAGAQVNLQASGGSASLGQTTVTAQGGGVASLLAKAAANLTATGNLSASNLGLGASAGKASIGLSTTGDISAISTITQAAGTTISATTGGNAGNATVDMQAGDCCTSAVLLNGTVSATVNDGAGDATVSVRGTRVAVKDVKSAANGSGNALLNVGAPTEIKLNGAIEVTAADASKRADIKLVSDRLTDSATKIKLSVGNGHVQLASFNTNNIIGVNSARDFDASTRTNYTLSTLRKLLDQQTEVTFGGEYDRSAWTQGSPQTAWVPGMASWVNQSQQVADIHVAADSNISLRDVKMVFDTTGTTYYHDPKMSSWSVPSGRVATYVMRPATNYDRYLDRTDYSLQNLNRMVDSFDTAGAMSAAHAGEPAAGAKQITGNLFMNGDGVNLARNTGKSDAASTPQDKDASTERKPEVCTDLNNGGEVCGL